MKAGLSKGDYASLLTQPKGPTMNLRAKAIALVFPLAIALAPATSNAESPTPMRPFAEAIVTKVKMMEAQACATRDIAHYGQAVVVPVDGGVEIDELTRTLVTSPSDPRFRLRVTDNGEDRKIEAFYRHPVSAKLVAWRLAKMKRTCGL
jgi:hypothetical protein